MAVAVAQRTLGQVVVRVAELTGDWANQGTATAGSTTTLTDANNERTPTVRANDITGQYVYVFGGTSSGTAREIITYGTIGVFTWTQTATAPSTDSTWVRLKRRPQLILDAIDAVTRQGAYKQALPYISEAVITNNLLQFYGAMEEWASGAASAPDGFTLGGAGASIARESTVVAQGKYSAALTAGAGAVGTLSRTIPISDLRFLDGTSLAVDGFLAENVASDAVLRIVVTSSAGTATNTDYTGTLTGNRWQKINDISSSKPALSDPMGTLQVQLRAALSATVYVDDLYVGGVDIRDYYIPPDIILLEPTIWMETGYGSGRFTEPLEHEKNWRLVREQGTTLRKVHFLHSLPSKRHLRIIGYQAPDVQATVTSNVNVNPEWLAVAAAIHLLEGGDHRGLVTEETERRLVRLQARLAGMERSPQGNTTYGISTIEVERP